MNERDTITTPTQTPDTAEVIVEPVLDEAECAEDDIDCVDEIEAQETAQIKAELKEKGLDQEP